MFLNDHQQHALVRFHSIKTNHSVCSFVVDKFETCRKKKKEGERESELVRTELALIAIYPHRLLDDLLHMCCFVFSDFF